MVCVRRRRPEAASRIGATLGRISPRREVERSESRHEAAGESASMSGHPTHPSEARSIRTLHRNDSGARQRQRRFQPTAVEVLQNRGRFRTGEGLETEDLPSVLLACRAPSRRNPERFVCGAKLGESLEELRFMGVVRRWADRIRATDAPRDVRRCPKCGWYNLYEPPER